MSAENTGFYLQEKPPQKANRYQKLGYFYRNLGFLPTSFDEVNETFAIVNNDASGNSVDRLLNRIYGYQLNRLSNPERPKPVSDQEKAKRATATVHEVARHYGVYRDSAHIAWTHLEGLAQDLTSSSHRDETKLGEVAPDYNTLAMTTFLRFVDLRHVAVAGKLDSEYLRADPLRVKYAPNALNEPVREHLIEFVDTTLLTDAMPILGEAISAERSRSLFWANRVGEFRLLNAPNDIGEIAVSSRLER